jgi:hypothetical protein
MRIQKNATIIGLVTMMLLNTAPVFSAESTSGGLIEGIKTLEASIDSGASTPTDAIDRFAKTIVEKNVSLNEVNAFVKTKMTAQQFSKFQEQINSSLRGIDPDTLTSSEVGDIVGQSLAAIHTEGLYWSGCSKMWTGAAVIVAAVIAGTIAVAKSKSVSQIQSEYNKKITDTTNTMNQQIADTNNWQQAYPDHINSLNADLHNNQSDLSYYESKYNDAAWRYSTSTTTSDQQFYSNQMDSYRRSMNTAQSNIDYDITKISYYSSKIAEYTVNPAQVSIDASAQATARDTAIANLNAQEQNAIEDAPANQKLGRQLGIGAGVGAAVGAGLLINGFKEGKYCI